MSFNIEYKKSVFKDLKRLPKLETKKILNKIDKELKSQANLYPILKGQFKGLRKLKVGNYRVIFAILEKDVIILRIYHRKDVYKK